MNNEHKTLSLEAMKCNAAKPEALLKQLANANRLLLLCNLVNGEKTVSQLSEIIGLSHSAISQHLAKLRKAGLVEYDKRGQMVYYRICSMEAQALLSVLFVIYCK